MVRNTKTSLNRITFWQGSHLFQDETYMKVLLLKFYKGCVAPEIVLPNIPVGKPVRDLRYPPL